MDYAWSRRVVLRTLKYWPYSVNASIVDIGSHIGVLPAPLMKGMFGHVTPVAW